MTESSFGRLVDNFAAWHVRNQDPDSPYAGLFSNLQLNRRSNGQIGLLTQLDASVPDAELALDHFVAAVNEGVGVEPGPVVTSMGEHLARPQLATPRRLPWLQATQMLGTGNPALTNPSLRAKYKSAYLRAALPQEQIARSTAI
ncbi:hypothetical protein AB0I53_42005 [Saccharopolyspora sp. NPDC050389]|uniref:hypothetical protein n=1 Tax=Saccharopolyspora sp. NPDC050389 TaxID=3155516 RepID=UPI0033EC788D